MMVDNFYAAALNDGGASMRLDGNTPYTGYMVGCYPLKTEHMALTRGNIEVFISDNWQLLNLSTNYVGVWFNDGIWIFDISKHIQDKEDALSRAQGHGQEAIWGMEEHQHIYVD